eukprot:Gb_21353 [translate_table: standard]
MPDCLGMLDLPDGDWYCPYCLHPYRRVRKASAKEVSKVVRKEVCLGAKERPSSRCKRVVKVTESTLGGCVLCRCEDFTKSGFGDRTVMLCDQCEKEFHVGCLRVHAMADLRALPEGEWFCSDSCTYIHSALQKSLASGPEKLPNYASEMLKRKQAHNSSEEGLTDEIRWQILHGKTREPDTSFYAPHRTCVQTTQDCFDLGNWLIPSPICNAYTLDKPLTAVPLPTIRPYAVAMPLTALRSNGAILLNQGGWCLLIPYVALKFAQSAPS